MRHLQINTQFFEDEEPPRLQFQKKKESRIDQKFLKKATAIISFEIKFKTLIIKRLLNTWNNLRNCKDCQITHQNAKYQSLVQKRLKRNISNLKIVNRSIITTESLKKKPYKSLSPEYSNTQTTNILNEILQRVKQATKARQQNTKSVENISINRRLSRIQDMLKKIKKEHKLTDEVHEEKTKRFKKFSKENININGNTENIEVCFDQISRLKIQIDQLKKTQKNIWKDNGIKKNNQQTTKIINKGRRTNSQSINLKSNINIQNDIPRGNTQRIQFTQSRIYDAFPIEPMITINQSKAPFIQNINIPRNINPRLHNRQKSNIVYGPSKIIVAGPYSHTNFTNYNCNKDSVKICYNNEKPVSFHVNQNEKSSFQIPYNSQFIKANPVYFSQNNSRIVTFFEKNKSFNR